MRGRKPQFPEPKSVGVFLRLTPQAKRELLWRARVSGLSQAGVVEDWLRTPWLSPDDRETLVVVLEMTREVLERSLAGVDDVGEAIWLRRMLVAIDGIVGRLKS